MSEIRKISIDLRSSILKSTALEMNFKVAEQTDKIIITRYDLYRDIYYDKKLKQIVFDDMDIQQKNELIAQTLKNQIKDSLQKNGIYDYDIIELEDQIQIRVRR